jgi:cytochrome bd-type quinol oxidase subunit 1
VSRPSGTRIDLQDTGLESTFLELFLYGEKPLGPKGHLTAAIALFLGPSLSGYFIIVANAFMQHPVGYVRRQPGPQE